MLGSNPSADPGAKTKGGCHGVPHLAYSIEPKTLGLARSDKSNPINGPFLISHRFQQRNASRVRASWSASSVDHISKRGRGGGAGPALL
jgi:hypothetical protein